MVFCQKRVPVCVVFFASPELAWCLAVSDPLRKAAAVLRLCRLGCVTFFV